MSDQLPNGQLPGGLGEAVVEPPAKRPCLNDVPPSAVPDVAITPVDDGSDFYNTPLGGAGTPVNNAVNGASSADNNEPSTPPKAAPLIPGLSLFNDSLKASQPENGSISSPQKTDDGGASVGPKLETSAEPTQFNTEPTHDEQKNDNYAAASASETKATDVQEPAPEEEEDEHPEWETDSSPIMSSSESSSDDSDEDADYPILTPEEQARILMQAEAGSDDEAEAKGKGGYVKTANEQPEEILPIPDITITPEMKIEFLGQVETIVENTVLIKGSVSGEYQVLESGSLLCFEDRTVMGVVSETLGRVEQPLYAVRYESPASVAERGISKGKSVFYVSSHSTFVFTQPLRGMKGSDASNFHDEEVGEDELDFSDDEAEAEYKRKQKQKRQEKKEAKNEHGGFGRPKKEPPGPSKLSQELNYDDEGGEDGYTPLQRPDNLHEMMGNKEAPVEGSDHSRGGPRGGRGRGTGPDRGSGRNRGGAGGGRGRGGGGSWESRHQRQNSQDDRRQRPQDRNHQNAQANAQPTPAYPPSSTQQQPQQPQPAPALYPQTQQQQQPFYGAPQQQYAPYQFYQQQYAQLAAAAAQLPFQMQYLQQLQQYQQYQQNQYANLPPGSHINPAFWAALQQQQQQQQQQQPQQQQLLQLLPHQAQNPASTFDQVKAQLDILRQLSGAAQPQGGQGQGGSGST
ncbi:putative snoRNP assembly factor Naf1 [Thermoascus aurantiacus ATCC 26904]